MPFRVNPQFFNPALYQSIRQVWYDGIPKRSFAAPELAMTRWFGTGSKEERESFDQSCHKNFRAALESIGPHEYQLPANNIESNADPIIAKPLIDEINAAKEPETPASTALSLFLLLDQMPRNIFRADQKLIYSHYDRLSTALARSMLSSDVPDAARWDLAPEYKSYFIYRQWFYMPLMHSERLQDHETVLELFSQAEDDAALEGGDEARTYVEKSTNFERIHFDIVKKFGRYPHRNKVMGRENTKEEQDYFDSGDALTFGTG